MKRFTIDKGQAKVTAFTSRSEKHGPNEVPAASLTVKVITAADALDGYDSQLNKLLFRKPGKEESVQGELNVDANNGNSARRFPRIDVYAWDDVFEEYEAIVSSGLVSTGELVIRPVKISNISFRALEGGMVEHQFSIGFENEPTIGGPLSCTVKQTIELTIRPREPGEVQEEMAA